MSKKEQSDNRPIIKTAYDNDIHESIEWSILYDSYKPTEEEVKEIANELWNLKKKDKVKKVLFHAVDILKNNKAHLITQGHIPKTMQEVQTLRKHDFHGRFDEIGLLYSDIFNMSFNDAIRELNIEDEVKDVK